METTNHPPLKIVRRQTDDSLTIERGKTDESLENYKGKAESETDKAVSAQRLEADRARNQRRANADDKRDDANVHIVNKDQYASERRLLNERNSEDTAIEEERKKNDLAIEVERDETVRILNGVVSRERETTDKNLSGERAKTDLDAETAARRLNIEQAAHSNTKSALTTREEFVAIVSHDLRNPIGAILTSAEVLLENNAINAIDDEAKRWIDIIKRNAETSLRLISDILDMERIVEGKLDLQIAPHRLGDLLHEAVENHAYLALAKQIKLSAFAKNFDDLINCDKDRVAQVLSNLISNAIKFTPSGGSVSVAAEQADHEIKVLIQDSGPGIPEEQKDRIFERFAQIGNKNRSGLGLGLYISKTLVELHHGKLWVESSDGSGSTFSFTLPKRSAT